MCLTIRTNIHDVIQTPQQFKAAFGGLPTPHDWAKGADVANAPCLCPFDVEGFFDLNGIVHEKYGNYVVVLGKKKLKLNR